MRRALLILAALALPLGAAACGDEDPLGPEEVEFDPSLGVDLSSMTKLPSGVYVQTLVEGVGDREVSEAETDSIRVDYQLWIPNGDEVDAGTDAAFRLTGVIPGFRIGVLGMREAERRLIVIPPELGYGGAAQSGVPAHSVLVFRVDLIAIYPEEEMPPPA